MLKNEVNNLHTVKDKKSIPAPIQTKPLENYYSILQHPYSDKDDDDDETVITSNKSTKHECDNATTTTADLTKEVMHAMYFATLHLQTSTPAPCTLMPHEHSR